MSEQNKETAGIITTGANMAKHFEVRVKPGKIEVSTIEGTGEIYVDKECKWGAVPGKTKTIEVEPGKHRVGVYMGGQFAYDQDVTVPEDGDPVLVGIVNTTKDAAEEATLETNPLMDFADAIRAVKAGKHICRVGWNGKHQFIELASCLSYKNAAGEIINAEHDAIGSQALAFVGTSGIQIGWLASQADMLANDWQIIAVPEPEEETE